MKVDSSPYLIGKIDSLNLHLSLPPFRDFTSLLHNLETALNKDLDGAFPWPCWRMDLKKKQQLHLPAATHERKSKWLVPWTEMVHLPSPTQRSGEPNNNRNNNNGQSVSHKLSLSVVPKHQQRFCEKPMAILKMGRFQVHTC